MMRIMKAIAASAVLASAALTGFSGDAVAESVQVRITAYKRPMIALFDKDGNEVERVASNTLPAASTGRPLTAQTSDDLRFVSVKTVDGKTVWIETKNLVVLGLPRAGVRECAETEQRTQTADASIHGVQMGLGTCK